MRIGFDIDGVLADFNTSFIALIKEVTGRDLFPTGYWPHTWNYPEAVGYTSEEVTAVWDRIKRGGTFWRNLAPTTDAAAYCQWVQESLPAGSGYHEFYFITSRMGRNVKLQTEGWCSEHLEDDNATVLISSEKGAIAKALNLDYYVDDRAENIQDVVTRSPGTQAYLLNQPWNQHMPLALRIDTLAEFLTAIDQHELTAAR